MFELLRVIQRDELDSRELLELLDSRFHAELVSPENVAAGGWGMARRPAAFPYLFEADAGLSASMAAIAFSKQA